MRTTILLATFVFVAAPAAADPVLVANGGGSITLTVPIDSAAPPLLLERLPRRSRNAAHARARAEAEAELNRAFDEATAQARDAARMPHPH